MLTIVITPLPQITREMTKRWRESKKDNTQKGERDVMTCSSYEDCLLEIPEREGEREVVDGEKNMRVNNRGERKKKYLKLLHNDFIHGGKHFQIDHKLSLPSSLSSNSEHLKNRKSYIESKYPKPNVCKSV